ncbi:hypothetical protein HQN89_26745 [Paenibacillus frigoriresistens]|uniref:hypothetical protein n=1 Tax=Paenibacillus alginolyticus TaxID=59839 RepID=UPI001563EC5E|nr:hypothetical protein [Paenibacillus frigoriresistens]NRF94511.1 hypothetical protein [Paenibacillus frigoriresistens]
MDWMKLIHNIAVFVTDKDKVELIHSYLKCAATTVTIYFETKKTEKAIEKKDSTTDSKNKEDTTL